MWEKKIGEIKDSLSAPEICIKIYNLKGFGFADKIIGISASESINALLYISDRKKIIIC